jgi:hypothetical protein
MTSSIQMNSLASINCISGLQLLYFCEFSCPGRADLASISFKARCVL